MNCVLFAKMDQVFSLGNRTLKKYWKNGKKYWKSQGKVREFCQSGKVGTLAREGRSNAVSVAQNRTQDSNPDPDPKSLLHPFLGWISMQRSVSEAVSGNVNKPFMAGEWDGGKFGLVF